MPGITTAALERDTLRASPGAADDGQPRVLDTYSLVYSFVLLTLVPSMFYLQRLPFAEDRQSMYTFGYVSTATLPFLMGLALTFSTDSHDAFRTVIRRFLVLTPLTLLSGVMIMFGSSLILLPVNKLLGLRNQGLAPFFWTSLLVVVAPLFLALARRIRHLADPRTALQAFAIAASIALVMILAYFTLVMHGDYTAVARKDAVVYVVGALTWYAPSLGIAAGGWRRIGLV